MNTLQLRDEQNAACGVASPEEVDQMPPNFTPPPKNKAIACFKHSMFSHQFWGVV